MPHSSGGGSSSGGSFGGSSGGGSSSRGGYSGSGNSTPPIHGPGYYRNWHSGSQIYVRYIHGFPDYRYWNDGDLSRSRYGSTNLIDALMRIVLCVIFCCLGTMGIFASVNLCRPITKVSAKAEWTEVKDTANCFTTAEEENIAKELHTLYEKTGVISRVITVSESDIGDNTISAYAEKRYGEEFKTENNWLIVFEDEPDGEWDFIGMQGNNTDPVLTEKKMAQFNADLTDKLWDTEEYTYGTAFVSSLSYLNTIITKTEVDGIPLTIGIVFTGIGFVFLYISIRDVINQRKLQEEILHGGFHQLHNPKLATDRANAIKPVMMRCQYCGGLFASGEEACPHCGASAADAEIYQMSEARK